VLAVVDLTPLARALVTECSRRGDEGATLVAYAQATFRALAEATWELAKQPSPVRMPLADLPRSPRACAHA
jgi:hypothetical protein